MTAPLEELKHLLSHPRRRSDRASLALPCLVRQAFARQTITYGDLALELGVHCRNVKYSLDTIGRVLRSLDPKIPPIQCLVVNQQNQGIGDGIWWFKHRYAGFDALSESDKAIILKGIQEEIYTYNGWAHLLERLELSPASATLPAQASSSPPPSQRGHGESDEHRTLKELIRDAPRRVGLPKSAGPGEVEHLLPSGDRVDVFFNFRGHHTGVEVKTSSADEAEITRGLYQCVKYRALLSARQIGSGRPPRVDVILAMAQDFPPTLEPLRHALAIPFRKI